MPAPPSPAPAASSTDAAGASTAAADWLRLVLTPGIGPVHGHRLLARIGSPAALPGLSHADLAAGLGSAALASALAADDPRRDAAIEAALAWRDADPRRRHLIALDDARYPARLLHLPDPPLLLFLAGDPANLARRQLAIVGSRRATALGLATATSLATALVRCGWTVTSGLAEGIDGAAHDGALQAGTAAAPTVAVMGTGIDRIYPGRHRRLAARIIDAGGALVTELAPGIGPLAANFPRRNRLIAALADGVLVVEAARSSGSLITARLAADLGREVLAVPGSIHSPQSRGCHGLLRDGATLVETLDDVLAQFRTLPGPVAGARPTEWEATWKLDREVDREAEHEAACEADREADRGEADREAACETDPARPAEHTAEPAAPGTLSVSHHSNRPNGAEVRHDRDSDPDTAAVLDLLAGGPIDADRLQQLLGWPIDRLLARLQRLEIGGNLGRDPTGHWFRIR